ncbi:MAG: hypothetical protein SGI77_00595 [Pirellulaceae bacterium]|nr:hypothetical protein [Pirellulaceae bacterium]
MDNVPLDVRNELPDWKWPTWDDAFREWEIHAKIALESEYLFHTKRAEAAKQRIADLYKDLSLKFMTIGLYGPLGKSLDDWEVRFSNHLHETRFYGWRDGEPKPKSQTSLDPKRTPAKVKKATSPGDAQRKLESAFVLHHLYEQGGISNNEPITINELARKAGVSTSTSKLFLEKWYPNEGQKEYQRDAKNDRSKLLIVLKQCSGESIIGMMQNYGVDPDRPREEAE